ncbi:MAG: PQQ-binding-like beta-propeller repeat protein [Phycisphaerae bacterium]|nr:PQQ-binding-like beta-propeller repeat protein [Phycisphaerae bacterium]
MTHTIAPSRRTSWTCRPTIRTLLAAPALLGALAAAEPSAAAQAAPSGAQATPTSAAPPAKSAREILDERYVVGPTAADTFGYRIVWQTDPLATANSEAQFAKTGTDSVWFADSAGSVVRVRRDNGETVWRASTYKGIEKVLSIDHLPFGSEDRVYVVTQINTVALEALTGALARRSPFAQLPTTEPAVYGPYMVYGTRNGLVSWYQYGTGYGWRATTIGGSVRAQPTVAGNIVLSGSTSGTVLALEAATTRVLWERRLSAGVETHIAADTLAAFVAGRDQGLWAFDLPRGRVLWHYFTQSQLLNDPIRIADGLYLQIPGEGLVSFNPHPVDRPEGEVRWKAAVPGNVIGRLGTNLLVWDAASSAFAFVDAGNGRVVAQANLPQVSLIQSVPMVNGDLYVCSTNGRVERLEPLARPAVPTGMEAAPAEATAASAQPADGAASPPAEPDTEPSAEPARNSAPDIHVPAPRFNQRLR